MMNKLRLTFSDFSQTDATSRGPSSKQGKRSMFTFSYLLSNSLKLNPAHFNEKNLADGNCCLGPFNKIYKLICRTRVTVSYATALRQTT